MIRFVFAFLSLLVYGSSVRAVTYIYKEGVGIMRVWETSDEKHVVGRAYCVSGDEYDCIRMTYKSTESDPHYFTLSTAGWYLYTKENCIFLPFNRAHQDILKTGLPVTYQGQIQTANDDASHIAAYDFLTARAMVKENEAEFRLSHIGVLLRIKYKADRSMTVNSLSLQTNKDSWKVEGKVNAVEGTFTPEKYDDSVTLLFDNVGLGQDEELIAYLSVAPVDLSNDTIEVIMSFEDGVSVVKKIKGADVKAGMMYEVNLVGNPGMNTTTEANAKGIDVGINEDEQLQVTSSNTEPRFYVPDIIEETDENNQFSLVQSSLLGDVNNDGQVTMADANMVVNFFLSGEITESTLKRADVNGDGYVTMADANMIVNIFLAE